MSSTQTSDSSKLKGMLTDVTKCIGCERCVEGCVKRNKLPRDFLSYFKAKDGLSGNRFTSIVKTKNEETGKWHMVRKHCLHCLDPSCATACLVGAFAKSPDGAVEYDEGMCIGCRYCMLACPFSIPRYEYNKPLPYVRKCKMNDECRVAGGKPACVTACPTRATIFDTRENLLKIAKKRLEENPGKYVNHIYGEHEFGGTSVMYISDIPIGDVLDIPTKEQFEEMRLPQLAKKSVPALVEPWVWVTPIQFFAVSAGLSGIWLYRRKRLLAQEKQANDTSSGKEGNDGK